MKKKIFTSGLAILLALLMTSCYTYTHTIGNGPQTGIEVRKMNHYLIYGLAPVGVSNPKEMVGDTKDYQITITHTFIDGLINALTFGIYTPTTTIITK